MLHLIPSHSSFLPSNKYLMLNNTRENKENKSETQKKNRGSF